MQIDHVTFAYGDKTILRDFELQVREGGILAVMGDSGVGKTTLLHLLSGLIAPQSGSVPACAVSYMFQQPRLLPNCNVLRNLTAIPTISEADARRWLQAVGLGDSLTLMPHQLSGGMAQRVSMARAFAYRSELLLMDEPFKGLDVSLQAKLHNVFRTLWQDTQVTTVLVTHDPDEAVALADRVVVLRHSPAQIVYDSEVCDINRELVRTGLRVALLA